MPSQKQKLEKKDLNELSSLLKDTLLEKGGNISLSNTKKVVKDMEKSLYKKLQELGIVEIGMFGKMKIIDNKRFKEFFEKDKKCQ